MPGPIICSVDDSKSAQRAARVARGLSAQLGLRLVFLRVLEADTRDDQINAVAERLEDLTEDATGIDCGAAWHVDAGDPADRLVAIAAAEKASLIVIGSQGSHSPAVGSICGEISRRAPCPVVLVPPGARENRSNGQHHIHEDSGFTGGIVRFDLGGTAERGDSDFAGGIFRFNLGSSRHQRDGAAREHQRPRSRNLPADRNRCVIADRLSVSLGTVSATSHGARRSSLPDELFLGQSSCDQQNGRAQHDENGRVGLDVFHFLHLLSRDDCRYARALPSGLDLICRRSRMHDPLAGQRSQLNEFSMPMKWGLAPIDDR
jgi:nucleotide-binding universal stress UspA family protein